MVHCDIEDSCISDVSSWMKFKCHDGDYKTLSEIIESTLPISGRKNETLNKVTFK